MTYHDTIAKLFGLLAEANKADSEDSEAWQIPKDAKLYYSHVRDCIREIAGDAIVEYWSETNEVNYNLANRNAPQGRWVHLFGAEWGVPEWIYSRFDDDSGTNDTCPSFTIAKSDDGDMGVVVFVDSIDDEYRGDDHRFFIGIYGDEIDCTTWGFTNDENEIANEIGGIENIILNDGLESFIAEMFDVHG